MSSHPLLPLCEYFYSVYEYFFQTLLFLTVENMLENLEIIIIHYVFHTMTLDLTGSQDGSVSLWEWGHQTAIATPRAPGTFAKVTRVRFSQHGNKFGVADSDGHLSLFQVACREGTARPFFVRTLLNSESVQLVRSSNNDICFRITNATAK